MQCKSFEHRNFFDEIGNECADQQRPPEHEERDRARQRGGHECSGEGEGQRNGEVSGGRGDQGGVLGGRLVQAWSRVRTR